MNLENLALRPNCLLTRYPLVFVSGPRSLFCPYQQGDQIIKGLKAHGYLTQTLSLPFRNSQKRLETFTKWIKTFQHLHFHFVMALEVYLEFEFLLKPWLNQNVLSTVTLITSNKNIVSIESSPQIHFFEVAVRLKNQIPLHYRLHQVFCWINQAKAISYEHNIYDSNLAQFDRFLDHCVQLAENDLV